MIIVEKDACRKMFDFVWFLANLEYGINIFENVIWIFWHFSIQLKESSPPSHPPPYPSLGLYFPPDYSVGGEVSISQEGGRKVGG